jgi:hypothetical protein
MRPEPRIYHEPNNVSCVWVENALILVVADIVRLVSDHEVEAEGHELDVGFSRDRVPLLIYTSLVMSHTPKRCQISFPVQHAKQGMPEIP